MIVPGSANALMLGQSSATGYNLTKSLRFRASASAYLNRTPSTTSGTQQYTISIWCKRGKLGSYQNILGSACPNPPFGNTNDGLRFNSSDQLEILARGGNDIYVVPSMLFRDPASWYHIVVAVDTTQVTASNRVKVYVNGVLQTSFYSATYPVLGYSMLGFNVSGYANSIASDPAALGTSVFDSYMAEINVISGSQQAVTAFGENNATTGVWQPKAYTGTYGTNGFYLPFTDVATTSGSNAGLGKDFSGNGNYWNTNNISVTAGSTYDSMTDVPTLTSASVANYCVLNPLITPATTTIINGNLGLSGYTAYSSETGTIGVSSGKWYFEFVAQLNAISGITGTPNGSYYPGQASNAYAWDSANTTKYNNNTGASYGAATSAGDIVGVAFDLDSGSITFYKNNVSQGTAYTFTPSGTYFPVVRNGSATNTSVNFGQQPFTYTPPTGYVALNTYNLPTSTIVAGNTVMDATIWTGDGNNPRTITNAAGFKPDLVWSKLRSGTASNNLYDSVRGTGKVLYSDLTSAEDTNNPYGYLTAFNSNGFSSTAGSTSNAYFNANGSTYVGWQWQAGQGTTSSNTSGSITSTVSVNPTAGFSIVTWTYSSSGGTIGHGLGVAPQFIIQKDRTNGTYNWDVYHVSLGATKRLSINNTAAADTQNVWNNTTPTSSVFSSGSSWYTNGENIVSYCWAEVAGFSKFGSFVGNGSNDGVFCYTGFQPKWVMIKCSSATEYWYMYDSVRNTYNVVNHDLIANLSNAEGSTNMLDFTSNGFKIRNSASAVNSSGATYIYACFASNPFKNSNAF